MPPLRVVADGDAVDQLTEDLRRPVHNIRIIQHLRQVINRGTVELRQIRRDLDGILGKICQIRFQLLLGRLSHRQHVLYALCRTIIPDSAQTAVDRFLLLCDRMTQNRSLFMLRLVHLRDMAPILFGEPCDRLRHHQLISEPGKDQGLQLIYANAWETRADSSALFFGVGTVVGTPCPGPSDSHVAAALAALDQSGQQILLAPQGDGSRLLQGLALCALARLGGVPERRFYDPKLGHVAGEKFSLIPLAGHAFVGLWILAIVAPVPDPRASVKLVVQNPGAASGVAVNGVDLPGSVARGRDVFFVQLMCNGSRAVAVSELAKDPFDDQSLSLVYLGLP